MNNILDRAEYSCSGCGACFAVCPFEAISLERDDYGLYVAKVNEERCVSCGKCKSVCSRYDSEITGKNLRDAELYALKSSDNDTVLNSSSGGLASELASYGLKHGYNVEGVVYDLDRNIACHRSASSEEGLREFAGSKYLQSLTEDFRNIREKSFIFGTPCQIAGMHKLLSIQGMRNDFILIEIFCHGVPSYKLWDEEVRYIGKKIGSENFDSLKFRYKKDDWHMYCLKADKNGKVYYGEREKDPFWRAYFEDVLLSDACYHCRLRKKLSQADIRLGDYWGNLHSEDHEGVSAAFVLTENGRKIIHDLIYSRMVIEVEKTTNEEMLRYQNMEGYHNADLHRETLEMLKSDNDLNKVIKAYRRKMPARLKLKRILLSASGIIPASIRYKVKSIVRR